MSLSSGARALAGVIALAAAASLGLQAYASLVLVMAKGQGPLAALWAMLAYFTILINLLVLGVTSIAALGGRVTAAWWAATTLFIAVVGLVHHLLLRGEFALEGWAKVADIGLHDVTPLLMAAFWLTCAPKAGLAFSHAAAWLAYPLGYCAYALVRGAATQAYPYPFIDAGRLGLGGALLNAAGLSVAFLVLGCLLVALARVLAPRPAA